MMVKAPLILRNEPIRRGGGKPHMVAEVYRAGGETSARLLALSERYHRLRLPALLARQPRGEAWGWMGASATRAYMLAARCVTRPRDDHAACGTSLDEHRERNPAQWRTSHSSTEEKTATQPGRVTSLPRLYPFDKKNKHRCAPGVCRRSPTIFNQTKTMNTKDLIRLGVPVGEPLKLAHEFIQNFIAQGNDGAQLEAEIFNIVANPPAFFGDELRAPLARAIYRPPFTPRAELAPWRQWGEGLEPRR